LPTSCFGNRRKVLHRKCHIQHWGDSYDRSAVDSRKGAPQSFVTSYDLIEAPLQGKHVEGAFEADDFLEVKARVARKQLVKKPQPLLRQRGKKF
jgi:hypothetical protein